MNYFQQILIDEEAGRKEIVVASSGETHDNKEKNLILIVEDDEVTRSIICKCLQKIGCKVLSASNGKDGLEMAIKHIPSVILLDSAMPVMNGAKFRQLQLRNKNICKIPTVLVSAINDAERKKGILANLHFLSKPISVDHLMSTIEYFIEQQSSHQATNQLL
jgi:CheY-like chemotaxis protein